MSRVTTKTKAPPPRKRRPLAPKYKWRCDYAPHLDILSYTRGEARAVVKKALGGVPLWGITVRRGECVPQTRPEIAGA